MERVWLTLGGGKKLDLVWCLVSLITTSLVRPHHLLRQLLGKTVVCSSYLDTTVSLGPGSGTVSLVGTADHGGLGGDLLPRHHQHHLLVVLK